MGFSDGTRHLVFLGLSCIPDQRDLEMDENWGRQNHTIHQKLQFSNVIFFFNYDLLCNLQYGED